MNVGGLVMFGHEHGPVDHYGLGIVLLRWNNENDASRIHGICDRARVFWPKVSKTFNLDVEELVLVEKND